jgi:aryl-alcohol dehydrogenase-like predicted oxidoreductase
MAKRKIGASGVSITQLVFGANVFGWTVDEKTAFKLLDAFVGAGHSCIDTADVYPRWALGHKAGESETIIGNWLKSRKLRAKIVIATKVGGEMAPGKKGLSKRHIASSAEHSLRRLHTDYIDLYQSHYDDRATPMEETFQAYDQLFKQGKVRVFGASNFTAERLERALEVSTHGGYPVYRCLQPYYNLYDRSDYESELEPVCVAKGLGVLPYSALASGFLTGKYRNEGDLTKSPRGAKIRRVLDARGKRILRALDEVAKHQNSTPAAVSLAWMMSRPSITAPIVSATGLKQLEELLTSTWLKLEDASLELLNSASG